METSVKHSTETVGSKEVPLTVTRQTGLQNITVAGEPVHVASVTFFDSPLGTSRCFTRTAPEAPPEERSAGRERIRDAAVQAMLDLGIW